MNQYKILAVTPCEYPDVNFVLSVLKSTAFPVLHLGSDRQAATAALTTLVSKTKKAFGVIINSPETQDIELPAQAELLISPAFLNLTVPKEVKHFIQVRNEKEALDAESVKPEGIIIKGSDGAGYVGSESSFILFQRIKNLVNTPLFIQGGMGIHTAPALMMAGAAGVVLDSQLALFPESGLPQATKDVLAKVDGTDTRVIDGFRLLVRPNSPKLPELATLDDIKPYLISKEIDKGLLPVGQDISISRDLVAKFKTIKKMVFGMHEAIHAHVKQAKVQDVISADNAFAKEFNIKYPIAQGPMTRVSDEPEFANAVAEEGGLPFIALSLVKGQKAVDMIENTKALAGNKTWGVGILGFAPQELRDEQLGYIKEAKPPVVLIAGGRPSQAKPLEELGIKTFLHVPSTSLLDMYLKEGATGFVFEGRECGGHVGPLSSLVLWDRQIERLLQEDDAEKFNILFAGGIHDALSTSMIATMAAPLAAKGAKIGVLMGTSYLFTKEAVKHGAILEQFQSQAVAHSDTVLLETAPGHETRCLNTPFADFFNQEKARLMAEGLDKKEIWAKLESLNVGRLRIASKGVERQADKLVEISNDDQLTTGMYMIGEVAALRHKVVSMAELHEDVATANKAIIEAAALPEYPKTNKKALDVAIVGMACIYPGAKDIDEYWKNILQGKDCVTEVPEERWNKDLYYDPNSMNGEKTPSKWGGFIPKIDFDPLEFGIPPQSLAAIEPTQLLSLLVAKKALEDAGYADEGVNKEDISVIFGAEGGNDLATSYGFRCLFPQIFGEIPKEVDELLPKMTEDSFPGVLANVISGRITNRLDLGGRNYTVDAACASSLAAVDLACQELILGKSEMVLAGGVDLHNGINDYLMFSSTHALSRKGRCKTFDKDADGIALGEGVAVVALKRLEDAEADGDKVYAVIKGVGGSSDGKSLGLTAPRRVGQVKALERAYESAGISPADAGLIEAHGTGTVVGDKTEISALTDLMLQAGATVNQTHLGSVKTQIGHTKCAAGIAGLIKTALALHHGVKPPTIQLENPNPFYKQNSSPFAFNTQAGIWTDKRRVAGISAFGFGGTNFHAVLESHKSEVSQASALKQWPAELFVFRGDNYEEAIAIASTVKDILDQNENVSLRDIAFSLATQSDKKIQLTIVAEDAGDLVNKLEITSRGVATKGVYKTEAKEGKLAFVFPGQGSQKVNMARELFVAFPEMRELLADQPELQKVLFPSTVFDGQLKQKQTEEIKDTRNAQPLLGVVDYAIANFLRKLGIEPDMVAGHSYGELPALCFANVIDKTSLVELSKARANSILSAIDGDPGTMLAVGLSEQELIPLLKGEEGVYVVNLNSPKQQVLAGATEKVHAFAEKLKAQNISSRLIPVACAFHSPLLAGAKNLYTEELKHYNFAAPTLDVWSNTTAALYPTAPQEIKDRLADHLVMPVKFYEQVEKMYADGARIFVEVGPGKVLSSLVKNTLGKDELLITTDGIAGEGVQHLLNAVAQYIATGRDVDLSYLFDGREAVNMELSEPSKYAKSKALWYVNGHYSVPAHGKLPAHGAKPITKQIKLTAGGSMPAAPIASAGTEKLVQDYLNNVKSMVDAQRDVILGYLGHTPQMPSAPSPQINIPVAAASAPESKAAPQPVQAQVSITPDSIKTILMDIVSEKTGYPKDMLGMDMDMEADLSIDSIKRMEITGELKVKLGGFKTAGKSEEALIEELAGIKTLKGLVDWIVANVEQTPVSNVAAVATEQVASSTTNTDIKGTLIDIVSEKTGYPEDMLGMDMDLEADLSIDSIKRMEIIGDLKSKLGGFSQTNKTEEQLVEELAAIKTLNGLVNWLNDRVKTDVKAEVIQTPVAEAAPSAGEAWTVDKIKALLIGIISDKTGYPDEMLGMEMDLEADLSIDSIKRMEIISELRTKLGGFKKTDKSEEALIEELAGIKTLQGLVGWLAEAVTVSAEVKPAPVASNGNAMQAADIPKKTGLKEKIIRLMVKLSIPEQTDTDSGALKGQRLAVTDDGGDIAIAVKALLENNGATVDIVTDIQELKAYDGLILLDIFESSKRPHIIDFVTLTKKLDPEKAKWVYAVSDLKGHFNTSKDIKMLRNFQGYSGFLKSLNKEWPQTRCRTINLGSPLSAEDTAGVVLNELLLKDNLIEVFYQDDKRQAFELVPTELTSGTSPEVALDKDSVILVLGGAQGITAEMMIRFSREYPCNYVLVGRSADPREEAEDAFTFLATKDEIKKALIQQGEFKKPAEIEAKAQKLFKRNQILGTIRSLEANGANVAYHAIDLRDESSLGGLLDGLYEKHGRIDGVIHGAGLLEDKLFQDKTPESFERVFTTKVTPIRVLAEKLQDDVQFVVLFSSVASVYGNKGQTDYAAANSVLDIYAWELKEKFKGKVISINWGPWKGAGMVSPTLAREYERRGIALIPLEEGMETFINEIKYGRDSQVLIMAE